MAQSMSIDEKTNVMRILDQKKLYYIPHCYLNSGAISGTDVAAALGQDPGRTFKTLVTVAKSGKNYVFMVPVNGELNLKKAAQSVKEKSIAMIPQKELLPLTGYVHGGCSPIGLKKPFPVTIDESCRKYDTIMFSAGKIGYQVQMSVKDLASVVRLSVFDIID